MENKNKVIITGTIAILALLAFVVFKSQSNSQETETLKPITFQDKSKAHTAYVRPSGPVKNKTLDTRKKAIKSKIAKFKVRAKSNKATLTPTQAHEFHNPNSQTLKTAKKAKAVEVNKNKPVTAAEKKKAAELAKQQAFMKEQCGDITDNNEKADCHKAVAYYLNEKKRKAIEKKAKEKAAKLAQENNNDELENKTAPNENSDNNEVAENDNNNTENIITSNNNINNNQNTQAEVQNPNTEKEEDNTPKTLAEWKEFMIGTDEEGSDLFSKAPILLAATNKSGKESLSINNFFILMNEYYLQSGDASLEALGIQTLNGIQSLESFRLAVNFLSQSEIASSPEQIIAIENNIRATYQQETQLTNLVVFLNTFALPTDSEVTEGELNTGWNSKDHLFLTVQYINGFANNKLSEFNINTEATSNEKSLSLINPLTSLQNGLSKLLNDQETPVEAIEIIRNQVTTAQNSVTALLEKVEELRPMDDEVISDTQNPTRLTNFRPR